MQNGPALNKARAISSMRARGLKDIAGSWQPLLPTSNPRGRPTSAFTLFVRKLDRIMRANGGELMLTKVKDEPEWYGTWLQALELLHPFLPATGFFPTGSLGRGLERIPQG